MFRQGPTPDRRADSHPGVASQATRSTVADPALSEATTPDTAASEQPSGDALVAFAEAIDANMVVTKPTPDQILVWHDGTVSTIRSLENEGVSADGCPYTEAAAALIAMPEMATRGGPIRSAVRPARVLTATIGTANTVKASPIVVGLAPSSSSRLALNKAC